MSIFDQLAEEKIRVALAKGQLSGLPGEGRPLEFDDDALVPAELRMSNRILRNAGYVPPAILELRELRALCEAIATGAGEGLSALSVRRMTSLLPLPSPDPAPFKSARRVTLSVRRFIQLG